ncbi:MAG: hypothetical protein LBL05_06110 [Synergistaceae bacterium]|nr:hypothetical protein [Synergistaceae bacterium]
MKRARIVNDLRGLSNAALLFYSEYKTWPLPGQEASLDAYLDRPIVLAEPPIYAKVMLADKSGDAGGMPELYIGVELIPEKNGTEDVQRVLSATANGTGLLQQPATHDIYSIYRSGLIVYIRIYGMEGAIAINDLQYLSEAARRFYEEYETWPVPGQEASLDAYCDRPIVLAEPPRYAKVTLTDKSGDANSPPEIYIGVESISAKYGSSVAEQFLARKAGSIGLLQQPVSGDIYKFGLSVYMRIQ